MQVCLINDTTCHPVFFLSSLIELNVIKYFFSSSKDKIPQFNQIVDCLQSSSMRSNTNYQNHLSTAVGVLLLFCEDMESVTRMNAEENLNKLIRFSESTNIARIQVDLYHEIKKNGNEKSLRICLNLFSYYLRFVRQRKARSYAQNLLSCIYAISKRKETLLIETLAEFLKGFCKYLSNSMNDNEVVKLIEVRLLIAYIIYNPLNYFHCLL